MSRGKHVAQNPYLERRGHVCRARPLQEGSEEDEGGGADAAEVLRWSSLNPDETETLGASVCEVRVWWGLE